MTDLDPTTQTGRSMEHELELLKFRLERSRYRSDLLKWVVVAIGAVISFFAIDYGKLELERTRSKTENQRQLLDAYLKATEAPQPDVWIRKLHVLQNFSDDEQMRRWAETELLYIQDFSAKDALYRETLKVASQLGRTDQLLTLERKAARARYEQLYWAELPYVKEDENVANAMIEFRTQLIKAESMSKVEQVWTDLDLRLISLSKALSDSTSKRPLKLQPLNGALAR